MYRMSIKEALEMADKGNEQCLYTYREGNIVFYVGRSCQPFERLRQHMGMEERSGFTADHIGQLIIDNEPESLDWIVDIGAIQELLPNHCEKENANHQALAEWLEKEAIWELGPCMNRMGNKNRKPLPEKYNKRPIANKGVKFG